MRKRIVWISSILVLALVTLLVAATTQESYAVTWTAPILNADGTDLTDLDGYYLCLKVGEPIPDTLQIADLGTFCTANFDLEDTETQTVTAVALTLGLEDNLYVRMAAYDTSGNVSIWSDETSTGFDKKSPGKIMNVTITRQATP